MRDLHRLRPGPGGNPTMSSAGAALNYLASQRLGRLATIDADGLPHVVPLGWSYNPALDTVDSAAATSPGRRSSATSKPTPGRLGDPTCSRPGGRAASWCAARPRRWKRRPARTASPWGRSSASTPARSSAGAWTTKPEDTAHDHDSADLSTQRAAVRRLRCLMTPLARQPREPGQLREPGRPRGPRGRGGCGGWGIPGRESCQPLAAASSSGSSPYANRSCALSPRSSVSSACSSACSAASSAWSARCVPGRRPVASCRHVPAPAAAHPRRPSPALDRRPPARVRPAPRPAPRPPRPPRPVPVPARRPLAGGRSVHAPGRRPAASPGNW